MKEQYVGKLDRAMGWAEERLVERGCFLCMATLPGEEGHFFGMWTPAKKSELGKRVVDQTTQILKRDLKEGASRNIAFVLCVPCSKLPESPQKIQEKILEELGVKNDRG